LPGQVPEGIEMVGDDNTISIISKEEYEEK